MSIDVSLLSSTISPYLYGSAFLMHYLYHPFHEWVRTEGFYRGFLTYKDTYPLKSWKSATVVYEAIFIIITLSLCLSLTSLPLLKTDKSRSTIASASCVPPQAQPWVAGHLVRRHSALG